MFPGTPQFSLSRNRGRKLVTAFLSPATASASADSIPGSKILACSFVSYATVLKPVRLFAPPPVTVSPVPAASLQKPVACSLQRSIRLLPVSAPLLGFLCPSGIKAFYRLPAHQPVFQKRPISFRSP